jgi:uncharacterized membrane protein YfcA
MLSLLFAMISLLYATVGQAGGTAFLALMAFASFPPSEMRPTALLLNIVVATYSTWLFNQTRSVDWPKLRPLLLASLPAALVGGVIVLDKRLYHAATGIVLLCAASILAFRREPNEQADKLPSLRGSITVGATVGFVSGLTGVGGGVFLAPILIGMHWASPKQTATLAAPFILANSVVGLVGAIYVGQAPASDTWLYALAILVGATIGASAGLRLLSENMTRYVLVVILASAGLQLLFF